MFLMHDIPTMLTNEFFSLSFSLDLVTTLLVLPTRSVGGTCALTTGDLPGGRGGRCHPPQLPG